MYLFSRLRHLNSASTREGIASAMEGASLVNGITGLGFAAWTTFASTEVGRISWTALIDSLEDLGAAAQKLGESSDYGDWIDANDRFYEGRSEDVLIQVVSGTPDPERVPSVVATTRAVATNGKLAAAMAAGIEIAETFTKITGRPVLFGAMQTGPYGGVVWIVPGERLSELEEANAALAADPSWLTLVDQHGPSFQPGVETTWYQRLS